MTETPQDIVPHIYLDTSGELRDDIFYRVTFDNDEFHQPRSDETIVRLNPSDTELAQQKKLDYIYVTFDTVVEPLLETAHDCPYDDGHITQHWWVDPVVNYSDGTPPPLLGLTSDSVALLMQDAFVEKMRESGLTGWKLDEVIFATQEGDEYGRTSNPGKYPKYWYLQFRGKSRLRTMSIRNAKNCCPHCGYGTLFCPGCRWDQEECPQCKEVASQSHYLYLHPEIKSRRGPLVREDYRKGIAPRGILEGEHWDGSDFIQIACGWDHGPFVDDRYILTKRALDWLIAHNTAPIQAGPIHVDVSRMSAEQLEKLEAAKDTKSLEPKE